MSRVQHRNLVRLFAVCRATKGLFKVTEHMARGTLQTFLQHEAGLTLELAGRVDICAQIACGMDHLEQHRLVLNNLKADKVLVGNNNVVKIADFSRAAKEGARLSKCFRCDRLSSEDLLGEIHSIKRDVFDYGTLLHELIFEEGVVNTPDDARDVISRCRREAQERPTFHHLYYFFDDYFVRNRREVLQRIELSPTARFEVSPETDTRLRSNERYIQPSIRTDVVSESPKVSCESQSNPTGEDQSERGSDANLPQLGELQVSEQPPNKELSTGIQEASGATEPRSARIGATAIVDELNPTEDFARENWRSYMFKSNPRGLCVIINNRDFEKDRDKKKNAKSLPVREGTDRDRDKLKRTFRRLGFDVEIYDNQTDTDMLRIIHSVALKDHKAYDCFVCCILTHGDEGVLYGSNGLAITTRDCTVPFRAQACGDLAGKPKLFFIQACQGSQRQGGYLQTDVVVEALNKSIPNESDYLIGCSTVPGYVSYRHKTEGSWYISKLTEALDKDGDGTDLLDILTQVNDAVADLEASEMEGGLEADSVAHIHSEEEGHFQPSGLG